MLRHAEELVDYAYDSVNTSVDTEVYKLVTMEMLDEAGVFLGLNTMVTGAAMVGLACTARSSRAAPAVSCSKPTPSSTARHTAIWPRILARIHRAE